MPTSDLQSFAKIVREKRTGLAVSQARLGKALGVTKQTISDVECAITWPRMPVVLGLCRTLDIDLPKGLDSK